MSVIYIHQYFLTPEEGGAIRSYHLAKGMVDAGIEVEMITSHNKPYYDFKLIEGIKVHYLPVAYQQQFGFLKRIWSFLTFARLAKRLVAKLPRPDYLYISSTPLTTGLIGLWAKRRYALPFIFEVRDLWPDAPIQVGAIKNRILKSILYRLEAKIYQHALKIVALSPGIANSIRKKSPDAQIHLIPNIADTDYFKPAQKDPVLLKKLGLKKTFTVTYTGAIGKVNAVEELLEIAKISQERGRDYQFIVIGEGTHVGRLLQRGKELDLRNFLYLPFGNKEKVADLLGVSDMAYISFDHLPVLKTNSPNKFFDALAAGKSILVNHKGWVHDLVKTYQLGIYYNPQKAVETFEKLDELVQEKQRIQTMQKNARQLAEQYFSKEIAIQRLLALLDPRKFGMEFKDEVYILTA